MGKRSFEEASIVATGVQTYESRFGKRHRGHDYEPSPAIAHWRCNLTALSQVRNLFFVSYSSEIYVYVPQFPTQALPRKPALIVPSQPSSNRPGLLDPNAPRAINNLVVQFLGNEEVVATVRDNGDVDAFLVRHIVRAIERRAESDSIIGVVADDVKPFFQSNVGMSAWGLAIHSESRTIAVTANTHNITVFRFGLVQADTRGNGDKGGTPDSRETDVTHQVINGNTNIPYAAFCNTGDDPTGRWLLTTDIAGYSRAVDLEQMRPAQTFRFGRTSYHIESHDRYNAGWGILFLDPRSFMPEKSMHAALGLAEGEALPGAKEKSSVWDIGATISHLPDCSTKFTATKKRRHRSSRPSSPATPGHAQHSQQGSSSPIARDGTATPSDEGEEAPADVTAATDEEPMEYPDGESDSAESTFLADWDDEDEGTEDSPPVRAIYSGRRIYGSAPVAVKDANICGDLPCPILHASVRSVYLVQPSNQREPDNPFSAPTVGFTNALHQLIQGEFAWLNVYERLSMNAYIPSIGIVVLASQKGRAVVISLTKLSRSTRYPPDMPLPWSERKTKYMMRIERVLPFSHQEEKMERPFAPLLGIAAGPIQGTEHLPHEQKRWRLMMTYADHSVLSYEISRRRDRDSTDLQRVVV